MKTALIFGLGYSGGYIADALKDDGYNVVPVVRDRSKSENAQAIAFDDESAVASAMKEAEVMIVTAPPSAAGDPVLNRYLSQIMANPHLPVVYLSTTAVYGDHKGEWVDEDTPVAPQSDRARFRVAAENSWRDLQNPTVILRLAGIYGPHRGPFQKLRTGRARRILKDGQVFSRIHVVDIARAVVAVLKTQPKSHAIYNLCDDEPAPPQDVIAYAATLLNLPLPPEEKFHEAELSSMAKSFYLENKRVRNDKIKQEIGFAFAYPNYRMGLEAVLREEVRETGLDARGKTR